MHVAGVGITSHCLDYLRMVRSCNPEIGEASSPLLAKVDRPYPMPFLAPFHLGDHLALLEQDTILCFCASFVVPMRA